MMKDNSMLMADPADANFHHPENSRLLILQHNPSSFFERHRQVYLLSYPHLLILQSINYDWIYLLNNRNTSSSVNQIIRNWRCAEVTQYTNDQKDELNYIGWRKEGITRGVNLENIQTQHLFLNLAQDVAVDISDLQPKKNIYVPRYTYR